jgi:tellurite resistance protein TerA
MITLIKGPVSLQKGSKIRARMYWPASTDFDLGAEVLYADGHTESVATFPAAGLMMRLATADSRIRHSGDVQRLPGATVGEESVEIDLSDDILAVLPWAYSAQSNGATSFYGTQVNLEVTDGQTTVEVKALDASWDSSVWTETVGMITNLPGEGPRVVRAEHFSRPGSELRPVLSWGAVRQGLRKTSGIVVSMDGPRNAYK